MNVIFKLKRKLLELDKEILLTKKISLESTISLIEVMIKNENLPYDLEKIKIKVERMIGFAEGGLQCACEFVEKVLEDIERQIRMSKLRDATKTKRMPAVTGIKITCLDDVDTFEEWNITNLADGLLVSKDTVRRWQRRKTGENILNGEKKKNEFDHCREWKFQKTEVKRFLEKEDFFQ